ncbi:MAG: sugar phosphate isomerase/epimerase [Candidatus Latescibacteria bacterium]|nr:sugar phosphate isomerase/epimerase [Candidatus Latescibacterota bacterium]
MFMNLSPGAIGIRATLDEAIDLAKATGFQGIDLNIREVAELVEKTSIDHVTSLFKEAGVRPGGWGLPVNWRGDEGTYQADLQALPGLAEVGAKIGCTQVPTWVLSFSDELPFRENFEWHVKRFRPVAQILKDHGCRLGLEFLGPKTIRNGHRYEFIHTVWGMLDLCSTIGTGNVGLLLDAWHWYTSHGTIQLLRNLRAENVVYVHINDAPRGIPVDEQIDNVRELSGATGVIDLVGFLTSLQKIGYDGPVTPEPFNKRVNEMEASEAARVTYEALAGVWRAAEL